MAADRTCTDCPNPISRHSKGRCRVCALHAANRDPVLIARRTEGNRRKYQDPEVRARHAEACRQAKRRAMQNPETMERLRELGRTVGMRNFARANTPEARDRARRSIQRRALAWCPEEHWALNEELRRKGLRLAERKVAILELVPGTPEHARREVANNVLKLQLRHERQRREAY